MTYETILVGINFDALSNIALGAAAELADRVSARRIHLVHVAEIPPAWTVMPIGVAGTAFEFAWDAARSVANQRLTNLERPKTSAKITDEVRIGSPAQELATAAAAVNADLIVIASHHRGLIGRTVLGSVAGALVRAAPCPVLVVGQDRTHVKNTGTVLAAVDLSLVSEHVLEHAAKLAKSGAARVRVVSIDPVRDTMARLPTEAIEAMSLSDAILRYDDRYRAELNALVSVIRWPGLAVDVDVHMTGGPSEIILETANRDHPDLIVIGTSGHNAWQRFFLGSTATRVLREAPCPVLVIPSPPVSRIAHALSLNVGAKGASAR